MNIKAGGQLVIEENIKGTIISSLNTYTYSSKDGSDFRYDNLEVSGGDFRFDLHLNMVVIKGISFAGSGRYNVENATAASAACHLTGITGQQIKAGLESYTGVKRRFDFRIKESDIVFIDDYAHHPTELTACISSVKELFPDRKVTMIFLYHFFNWLNDSINITCSQC